MSRPKKQETVKNKVGRPKKETTSKAAVEKRKVGRPKKEDSLKVKDPVRKVGRSKKEDSLKIEEPKRKAGRPRKSNTKNSIDSSNKSYTSNNRYSNLNKDIEHNRGTGRPKKADSFNTDYFNLNTSHSNRTKFSSYREPIFRNDNVIKKSNTNKLIFYRVIIVLLTLALIFSFFCLAKSNNFKLFKDNVEKSTLKELPKTADLLLLDEWNDNHDKAFVKNDYVGQIVFPSGLIDEPVMQGETNDTYLRRNFETYKYDVLGPVFMDYTCDRDTSQNIILYGHNMYSNGDSNQVMRFTPLHCFEDEEHYDENKIIYMAYEDRVDVYLVAYVYNVKVVEKEDGAQYLVKGEPKYYLTEYGFEEFKTYKEGIEAKQLYKTGVEISNTDKLLTLQTCYENSLNKLIIVAKLIDVLPYVEN